MRRLCLCGRELDMLTTVDSVNAVPGMRKLPAAWMAYLIEEADKAIKTYCKRDLERVTYTDFYSGTGTPDLILRQWPVISITNIWVDPKGYWGDGPSAFGSGTALTAGTQYALVRDEGTTSKRGIVKRIGGTGPGYVGFYPENYYSGKLSAYRMAGWSVGQGNIKVTYVAGYDPVPKDLEYACNMLVAWMVRNLPSGTSLQSEGLGSYNYSAGAGQALGSPELGGLTRTLAPYREVSW